MTTLLNKKLTALITVIVLCITIADAQIMNPPGKRFHRIFFPQLKNSSSNPGNNSLMESSSNAPCIQWQKTYGGSGDEDGGLTKLRDGDYLEWGSTSSSDGDFTNNKGGYDAFLMKLDHNRNILWQKTYGGSGDEDFATVIELADGFMIMGTTSSNDGDVSGNHGGDDIWVVKMNRDGNIISQHCYGGSEDDVAYDNCIVKMSGDSYVFAANSNSNDGNVSGNHGDYDDWLLKINGSGNIVWSKCIGGSATDYVTGLIETNNHQLILAGGTNSNDGDVSGNHGGEFYGDAWVVKVSGQGNILWSTCYGGSGEELTNNITMTSDGNIALGTASNSNDGDVSGNHGDYDMWIPKINSSTGLIIWQKCLGSSAEEGALGIMSTNDGGVVALGEASRDFDYKHQDAQAIKLDANGNEIWTKTFGGSAGEFAFMGVETDDGSVLIQCNTDSHNGDVTNQHGPGDAWLVKLGNCTNTYSAVLNANDDKAGKILFSNYPNPFSNSTTISFSLPYSQKVTIQIFDAAGRSIQTLANAQMQAGAHQLIWNTKDEKGNEVKAGIYFLRMNAGIYTETRKLVVVK